MDLIKPSKIINTPKPINTENIKDKGSNSQKNLLIILGILLVVAIIIVALTNNQLNKGASLINKVDTIKKNSGPTAPAAEQPYVPVNVGVDAEGNPIIPESLEGAVVSVPGANPISQEGTVMTPVGVAVRTDVEPMSPEAPKQTAAITEDQLPQSVIKLKASATGWDPKVFTVKSGTPITLGITSADATHIFKFSDPSLSAVAVGISSGETRAITFNAPEAVGEYTFFCDVPGHTGRGEAGKMIVK